MVKRRKNRYRPLANPTHCARCGSTNLAIKNDAKPEIQNDGATPSFFCTDCRTRCHTAIVEEHQSRLDNTRQLAIMRGLSSTEDTRTERWLVTCDDIVRQNCSASTIFAGWRQSVLPVHLLGLDALLGCVGAVAGDVKLQDDGVVHHPVNRRGGGHGVGKDAFPKTAIRSA